MNTVNKIKESIINMEMEHAKVTLKNNKIPLLLIIIIAVTMQIIILAMESVAITASATILIIRAWF